MAELVQGQPGFGMLTAGDHLEVWGDPIAHSRSPQLHAAAYRVLGLDWHYDRRRVNDSHFAAALSDRRPEVRGLSLTMPLKGAAWAAARSRERRAELTGAVNTLLLTAGGPHGFNTDVGGLVRDLREHGVDAVEAARLVGAGATATSALVSLADLGATRVEVVARRPDAATPLIELGEQLGVDVRAVPLEARHHDPMPLTVAALPGGATIPDAAADALAEGGGILYDVVYGHWPTGLAQAWERAGERAIPGLGMLVHQALLQVRVFVTGEVDEPLDDEASVLQAMREAVADA